MTGVVVPPPYSHRHPFAGTRLSGYPHTPPGSPKDTQHHAVSLAGSGLAYQPGDALGVYPRNADEIVDAVLGRLGATGGEPVAGRHTEIVPLREALATHFDLSFPGRRLLEACAERDGGVLRSLLQKGQEESLKHYLSGWDDAHDVLDVLNDAPRAQFAPEEFVKLLRALQPRLYSIASSLKRHPDQAHLLVVSVTYTVRGRLRRGACSTFINERWQVGEGAGIYTQNAQKHFGMPTDPSTSMIMVGPGTGLAPFRAFLEEREATGATGRNWLFFGEQSRKWGFFYQPELTAWAERGFTRLDTAFSRDQPEKLYVQHRMREHARDIYAWLEEGAEFFICGDKERMATDVQRELLRIVELEGGRTPEQAQEYVDALKRKSHRLKLDVY